NATIGAFIRGHGEGLCRYERHQQEHADEAHYSVRPQVQTWDCRHNGMDCGVSVDVPQRRVHRSRRANYVIAFKEAYLPRVYHLTPLFKYVSRAGLLPVHGVEAR